MHTYVLLLIRQNNRAINQQIVGFIEIWRTCHQTNALTVGTVTVLVDTLVTRFGIAVIVLR